MKKLVAMVLCTALVWTSGSMQLCAAAITQEESSETTGGGIEAPGENTDETLITEEEQPGEEEPGTEEEQPGEEEPGTEENQPGQEEEPGIEEEQPGQEEEPGIEEEQPGEEPGTEENQPGQEEEPGIEEEQPGEEEPGTEEGQPGQEEEPGTEEGQPVEEEPGTEEEQPADPEPMPSEDPADPSAPEKLPEEEPTQPVEEKPTEDIEEPSEESKIEGGRREALGKEKDLDEDSLLESMDNVRATGKAFQEAEAQGAGSTYTRTAAAGATAQELQELLDLNADGKYEKLTINIPRGTYNLDRTLYVYPNTTIQANKSAHLTKMPKADGTAYGAMLEAALTDDKGGYNGNRNITIDGGIWDSRPLMKGQSGTETFRFIHCNNINIKNAVLCNVPEGSHLIVFSGVQNATVDTCEFYGYGNDGKGDLTPKEAVQLDVANNVNATPTLQSVKWDDLPCDKITIKNCNFHDFSRGFGSHTMVPGRYHSNVTVDNNKFTNMSESAVRLYNYKDSQVTNNQFNNVVEGILVYTYLETAEKDSVLKPLKNTKPEPVPDNYKIQISRNTINKVSDPAGVWGDGIRIIGKSDRQLKGVTINNNTIQNVQEYGIFATTAQNLSINGNTIENPGAHGILLEQDSSSSTISKNKVTGGKEGGIAIYSSEKIGIYSNTASVKEEAIYLLDAANCEIGKEGAGNTVRSTGEYGISLSSDPNVRKGCKSTKVQYNTVNSAKTSGIFVYKSTGTVINRNTVKEAGQSGILVTQGSNSAKVTNNVIESAKENGIGITESSKYVEVTGNTVNKYGTANTSGKKYGIIVSSSGGKDTKNTKVLKNKINGTGTKTGRNGIQISSSSYVTVSGNTVTKPDGAGIYAYKSKYCTVGIGKKDYNTVKNPTEEGIYLTQASDNGKILYNKVSGAKADGIGGYKSKSLTITGNTVSSRSNGIYVNTNSTSAKIANNVIDSAGNWGIAVTSGSKSATISGNTIKKYSARKGDGCGIYIYKSAGTSKKQNKVVNNTITGNGTSTKKPGIKVSESDYTTVSGNTVTKPDGAGIYAYKSKYCTVGSGKKDYNTVKNPMEQGIYLTQNCDNGKILYNKVSGTKADGIGGYKSKNLTITGNTVSARKNGIYVNTNSTSAKITSNVINSAGDWGIAVTSGSKSATISGNTIKKYSVKKGDGCGIYIYKSAGTSKKRNKIVNNTITGTGTSTKKPGIKISESAYTTIEKNNIKSAAGAGIYVYKSKSNIINKNTIDSPKSYGITVTTNCDGAKVTSNTIKKAADVSIFLYKAPKSTVSSNKITTTRRYRGIWVSTSNNTKITSNEVKGAKKSEEIVVTSSSGCTKSKNKIR